MKRKIMKAGLCAALGMGLLCAFPLTAGAAPVFPQGITLGDLSLYGMTPDEVVEQVNEYVDELALREITLSFGDRECIVTAGELGFSWLNPEAVGEAAGLYTGGSLIHQFVAEKKLEESPVVLEVQMGAERGKIEAFVAGQAQEFATDPVNATFTLEDGGIVITEGVNGRTVDVDATVELIEKALDSTDTAPAVVMAVQTILEPEVTAEDLSLSWGVLGSFSTEYEAGTKRASNIEEGVRKINGWILAPGETFSGYEALAPFTEENGYIIAPAYDGGQVVNSMGGGVCQIATTVYNAALNAELTITQRNRHSLLVGYVEPSMDAAIAGTVKDIKITNDYETPVMIGAEAADGILNFTIYGCETRPENREVSYVSKVLSTIDPGTAYIEDVGLAPGQVRLINSGMAGARSELWKVITIDGQETERILISSDSYSSVKETYHIGPAIEQASAEELQAAQEEAALQAQLEAAYEDGEYMDSGLDEAGQEEPYAEENDSEAQVSGEEISEEVTEALEAATEEEETAVEETEAYQETAAEETLDTSENTLAQTQPDESVPSDEEEWESLQSAVYDEYEVTDLEDED